METKKKFRKKKINKHIRSIVRDCCIIIGGRNNKLKDQKGWDQKGLSGQEAHQKKSCYESKGPFQKHMAGQNLHK